METKDTLSSCSDLDEQEMQQLQKQAKIFKGSCLNGLSSLKSNFTRKLEQGITKSEFERAFSHIFSEDVDTFTRTFSQNMDTLEQQLTKETILESNCKNAFRVLKTQFEKIFTPVLIKPSSLDESKQHIGDESSRSRNECNDKSTFRDDMDIRPSYDTETMVEVPYTTEYNMFVVDTQHSEQPECIINTCVVEKADSNVTPDSPDMCNNEIQTNHNVVECDDERVVLANLKLDIDDNKTIQKQLKKANASLTQELKECKSTPAETSRTLEESNSIQDSCLVALQNKQTEFERYKAFNDHTVDYDKLERKLNETLGLLAKKDIDIKEGLKVKAYFSCQEKPNGVSQNKKAF
ncbi:hypothetical protein Tco_1198832 [Tanacetum coccineum]